MARDLGLPVSKAYQVVEKLRNKSLIKQHSRDSVTGDHPMARYYTNHQLRPLIEKTLTP